MAKFKITVTESYSCEYEIEAECYEIACEIVDNKLASGEIDTVSDYMKMHGSYSCEIF